MWHYPQGADGHDRDPAVSYAAHRPQQAPHSSQKRAPLILLSTRGGGALIGRPPACRLLEVKGRRARRGEGGRQADSSEGDVYGELRAWWHPGAGAIELPRQRGAASLHRLRGGRGKLAVCICVCVYVYVCVGRRGGEGGTSTTP